jgi:hypothetical protein
LIQQKLQDNPSVTATLSCATDGAVIY